MMHASQRTDPATVGCSFVCPRCRGELRESPEAFACLPCSATYPIVVGIPDFRVDPDPWISLDDDRTKARRLEALIRDLDFADSVRAYWEITPETPVHLAARFIRHMIESRERSSEWLDRVASDAPVGDAVWLDLGCGTGDLAAAATQRGKRVIGADIALRWLVIARKRPELGPASHLVCCGAEHLPFSNDVFSRVMGLGLLEHVRDNRCVLREAHRVLVSGGKFLGRTVNRYTLLREPHVGIWGVGFVPRRWSDRYVRWRGGGRYLHHRPVSAAEARRGLHSAGFRAWTVRAAATLDTERWRLGRFAARAVRPYEWARRTPVVSRLLAGIAPLLDVEAVAS